MSLRWPSVIDHILTISLLGSNLAFASHTLDSRVGYGTGRVFVRRVGDDLAFCCRSSLSTGKVRISQDTTLRGVAHIDDIRSNLQETTRRDPRVAGRTRCLSVRGDRG